MHNTLQQVFRDHPESVGESYTEHFQVAGTIGWKLLLASLAAFMHGLFPCLFKTTASEVIEELHQRVANRGK